MSVPLKQIMELLERKYPAAWGVSGDRFGLEVGDPEGMVDTLLVALEITPAVIREAETRGAQLLLTHHPLFFRPLPALRADDPVGRLAAALAKADIALISCHTNLDVAPGGINDYLAQKLGLAEVQVLSPTSRDPWVKLAVFVPVGYEDPVRQALSDAGLGIIGRYADCSFSSRGEGTYQPLEGARPWRGEPARLSRAAESRLEILAPQSRLPRALARLKEVHPYEEVTYDLYPLNNPAPALGLGRIGLWPRPKPFSEVIALVKEIFGVEVVRVWGEGPGHVTRVALCSGSGGDLIGEAGRQGAQLYLTGEVRHHQASPGDAKECAVAEVGHYASEAVFMTPWAEELQGVFQLEGIPLTVMAAASATAPYRYV